MHYVLEQRLEHRNVDDGPLFEGLVPLLFRGVPRAHIENTATGIRVLAEDHASLKKLVEKIHTLLPDQFRALPVTILCKARPRLEVPVMALRIVIPAELDYPVRRCLAWRSIQLAVPSFRAGKRVLYATARLSSLLGLDDELENLSGGRAEVSMKLSHYEPVYDVSRRERAASSMAQARPNANIAGQLKDSGR